MAGAPTKYISTFNKQAYKLCLLGATDEELADFFEVVKDTINEWKRVYPQFSVSIKKGKIQADANVAESLYKRANGYKYNEVTFEKVDGKEILEATTTGEIKKGDAYRKKVTTKEIAPDTAAAIIWLKNRQKEKWRDKQEIGITDKEGNDAVTIFQLPDNGRNSVREAPGGIPDEGAQQ